MKMAYIAIEPKTNWCFAICSADPDFIADSAEDLQRWKKGGATMKLLPADEAKKIFRSRIRPESDKAQMKRFWI